MEGFRSVVYSKFTGGATTAPPAGGDEESQRCHHPKESWWTLSRCRGLQWTAAFATLFFSIYALSLLFRGGGGAGVSCSNTEAGGPGPSNNNESWGSSNESKYLGPGPSAAVCGSDLPRTGGPSSNNNMTSIILLSPLDPVYLSQNLTPQLPVNLIIQPDGPHRMSWTAWTLPSEVRVQVEALSLNGSSFSPRDFHRILGEVNSLKSLHFEMNRTACDHFTEDFHKSKHVQLQVLTLPSVEQLTIYGAPECEGFYKYFYSFIELPNLKGITLDSVFISKVDVELIQRLICNRSSSPLVNVTIICSRECLTCNLLSVVSGCEWENYIVKMV